MGDLAVDTLWDVAKLLETREAGQAMRDAYSDEVDGEGHAYNLANLVCLGKKPVLDGGWWVPVVDSHFLIASCCFWFSPILELT